jgi:hypothetical protein
VSTSPANPALVPDAGHDALAPGEPVVHFVSPPGKVEVEVKDLGTLFDRTAPPTYPHTGPMVNKAVATFLLDSVREQRRRPKVEVTVAFQRQALQPEEEARPAPP